jgi:hypothetical protein
LAGPLLLLEGFVPQQDHANEEKAKFDREANPVRKAKLMPQLGNTEFQEMQTQIGEGDFESALKTLELYRDQVADTEKALDATGADPSRHSSGYRQLEISVRQALRRLDDMVFGIPLEDKKSFTDVRDELNQIDQRLIRQLFPGEHSPESSSPRPNW